MANVRDRIALSEEEISAFIENAQTVIVGSNNHDGVPHMMPMWYSLVDGLISMHTYGASQKVVNLRRDPRGSALVEDGDTYGTLRGVFQRGYYDVIDDQDLCVEIGVKSANKYQDIPEDLSRPHVVEAVRKRVALVFHPEKTTSWDHRKLRAAGASDNGPGAD
jgi:nitroimidazol reductase NimA-like FMN-containing flavoprotein (pyridoxamine 5'-phosphate oxidase superfamily)